jgi:photosystem II stability/assembly factor-like uncharacterized protein
VYQLGKAREDDMAQSANGRPIHVYAGVNRIRINNPNPGAGGVFRMTPDEGRWECVLDRDIQAIAVHPDDRDVVYAATDDGPYRSVNGGDSWERTDYPKGGARVWSIIVHPANPKVLYAGTSPIGIFRSEDGGDTWRELPKPKVPERCSIPFAHRVMKLAIHPKRPDEIFAVLEINGVMRSTDAGETWQDCNPGLIRLSEQPHLKNHGLCPDDFEGMLDGHSIAACPRRPGSAVVACRMGLFQSDDGGESWRDLELARSAHLSYGRDVRASGHDPNVLFVGVGVSVKNDNGAIYRSADAGRSWRRFDRGVDLKSSIMCVAEDRRDPNRVFGAARFGQVIGTQDGGRSWREYPLPEGCTGTFAIDCG